MSYLRKLLSEASDAMFKVYIGIFLLVVLIFKTTVTFYFLDSNASFLEYFKGNLLPEFTGMVVELMLFIFVIDVLRDSERKNQERLKSIAEHNEKVEIEHRLRHQLRILVRRVFEDVDLDGSNTGANFKFHASEHEENQKTLRVLKSMLSDELDSNVFADNLVQSALFELPMIMSLASVNSNLSGRHLKAWMAIIFFLKQISEKKNLKDNTERLIDWIAMFDKFSFQQKLV
ncbi:MULTISPECIES: hypothetical protein [Vibrio]|uniref:hypothetical protein n=1 Tax=Vibrio TaxID=662 RepID=UPI00046E847E|nr:MULTISPECIES: hypothetical protein [Vibrio]EGQ9060217.1 hypothetical protein [Vibrio parahaemolyticus]EGR1568918.1 hypothetical protein [Vibrio parahaemolyticus]EIF2705462.1 hypothetical protein [Vibrio alginolyticus]EJC7968332.1 hypothetical protein [Vibrio parahaemolyticus]EJL6735741.1 hypothetical protein [Vibrio alginolyticus]